MATATALFSSLTSRLNVVHFQCLAAFVPVLYICYVRSQRWKRYHAVHEKYRTRYEKRTLTPEEAQAIVQASSFYDMPMLLNYSLAFALFKTYGIPSISKILAGTKELRSTELVSKRCADTEILISTWVACPISGFLGLPASERNKKRSELGGEAPDPRAMIALARVNWLHARYKITNDDYLYTLCLFAFEPPTWAARYGWRALSDMECYAYFIFWKEIGRRMGIQDIPDTMEEMKAWSIAYEKEHMVPAQSNKDVAGYTTEELLHVLPEAFGIKQFARDITVCLLEDRVRIAMMQPAQPWYMHFIINSAFYSLAFVQRWLCLPRRNMKSIVDMTEAPGGPCPWMHPTRWQVKPWYKPESTGLGYWKDWLLVKVGVHTEMPGPHLKSGGYRLEEMGPSNAEDQGYEEIMKMAEKLQGCPVTGPWVGRRE
ncbi:Mycophenolic acid synthesis protein B [Hypsizygus marmoreus]|uniref:Mycophenolic acid synthesis protein B n=1 Tax=Hypsizygus marmoreus TaxID=39966 RepID=A0A369JIC3_HYPMA|nr:Mycophenolic acid synthesis protein B [Hypsizygus marmoreus]